MGVMRDFVKHYLQDIDLGWMTKGEKELFSKFVLRYHKELVNVGYLLKDVDFEDLSNPGRRMIVSSALRVWKMTHHEG